VDSYFSRGWGVDTRDVWPATFLSRNPFSPQILKRQRHPGSLQTLFQGYSHAHSSSSGDDARKNAGNAQTRSVGRAGVKTERSEKEHKNGDDDISKREKNDEAPLGHLSTPSKRDFIGKIESPAAATWYKLDSLSSQSESFRAFTDCQQEALAQLVVGFVGGEVELVETANEE